MQHPVIRNVAYCLAHTPDLVRYGSKPRREAARDPAFAPRLAARRRDFAAAQCYPPNQVFVGQLSPETLATMPRPWYSASLLPPAAQDDPFGEVLPQPLLYALLERADVLEPGLISLNGAGTALRAQLAAHPVLGTLARAGNETMIESAIEAAIAEGALPLYDGDQLYGCMQRDDRAEGRDDESLSAQILLEALCAKATGAAALTTLLRREQLDPAAVDFVISCGEEACGDRYQRGGGGMAKSIGEMCGLTAASGMDVKNFCAGPGSALMTAAALVKAGLFERVAVVAGGSLAKLGMKCEAFIREGVPMLDDCLASMALLVTRNDGASPRLLTQPGAFGLARIGSSTSDEAVYRQLILEPLAALGLTLNDIDKFAPELHNPEIMEFSGSGDVVHKNYRMIAATAVRAGIIDRADMAAFIARVGLVGFAPTQGHIPSAVPYVGHAMRAMARGELHRVMFLCKASLFLNRLTELYDGISFVLEAND